MSLAERTPLRRVLIISGAGASARLGAHGQPIPQMTGWATHLVSALGPRAGQLGITADMPGDKFEAALGRFLAFEASLPSISPLLILGIPLSYNPGGIGNSSDWFSFASGAVVEIRQQIWRSLYENFGLDRIDEGAATESYRRLHELVRRADGDGPESYINHATTNYDPAIELAVENDDRLQLVDGFIHRRGGGQSIYAPNTLESSSRLSTAHVPVLHIHGAVGWYLRPDGSVMQRPAEEHFDDRRIPALLLPDDTKSPAAFSAPIRATWDAFRLLLAQATHIIFLGHSLHDQHIVEAVRERNGPVAVIAYAQVDEQGTYMQPSADEVTRVRKLLPQSVVIPGQFGQRAAWFDIEERTLVEWMLRTTAPSDSRPSHIR